MEPGNQVSFDEEQGGSFKVPDRLTLVEFGKFRVDEILMLSEVISEPTAKGQLFQKLPKHMRRRQMSHNNNRLPRRLQSFVDDKPKEPSTKRPSRKFRRKPGNIAAEFARRQINKFWLETHVWHAKRFHMVEKWGYRLPDKPTNKGFRANYRAAKSHCLLTDMSYLVCFQLEGTYEDLKSGLSLLCNQACGLTAIAKMFSNGEREGRVPFFQPNTNKIIGYVTVLWQPSSVPNRTLWLWAHPAFSDELEQGLCKVFNLEEVGKSWKSEKVTLSVLKNELNRVRLVGPLSSAVLGDALSICQLPAVKKEAEVVAMDVDEQEEVIEEMRDIRERQKKVADRLSSTWPTQYPSGVVLGLLVKDPRLTAPLVRTKSTVKQPVTDLPDWDGQLSWSPIWDSKRREAVSKLRQTDAQICAVRANTVIPGNFQSPAVPILLIQQPGVQGPSCNGFGAGWDVVIPKNWGLPLWRAFVSRGARTGGLREVSHLSLEMGSLQNTLLPDSAAGLAEQQKNEQILRKKFFSLPPAKRPNFIKLGVFQPFSPPWSQIGDQSVIRDFQLLSRLDTALRRRKPIHPEATYTGLIAVKLKCITGKPQPLARIHLPTSSVVDEPLHDDNSDARKKSRKEHRRLLLQWKRDRKLVKEGKTGKWNEEQVLAAKKERKSVLEESWLPDMVVKNCHPVVGFVSLADFVHSESCGAALGFIDISAVLSALDVSVKSKKPAFLFLRNVHETRYHSAELTVILE